MTLPRCLKNAARGEKLRSQSRHAPTTLAIEGKKAAETSGSTLSIMPSQSDGRASQFRYA
ncbi:hypothetical protein [Methylosinus sp. Ce-a6]|uniref:hypothetical protein n=1 Tax=Methylosinus sp. Ce-a6 TaxID=2172005 RepID=UPI001359E1D8|nr:hypothetical protein [Methylosinus sp. Ce-a6]